jgi:hypothetical protein
MRFEGDEMTIDTVRRKFIATFGVSVVIDSSSWPAPGSIKTPNSVSAEPGAGQASPFWADEFLWRTFPCPGTGRDFLLRVKKAGRVTRRPTQIFPQASAHVSDALLSMCFGRGRWLRRELKHGCRLILAQERQQHSSPIRKFERIVMGG